MRPARTIVVTAGLGLVVALAAGCSSDDKSSKSTTTTGGVTTSTAEEGTTVSIVMDDTEGDTGPMTMTVSPASVPAGPVTFTAENTGTVEHEMVVLKTDTAFDALPINADGKVSEADSLGEIEEFEAGETKSLTLDLEPGAYVLVCNIKDHYEMGMRAAFTVT